MIFPYYFTIKEAGKGEEIRVTVYQQGQDYRFQLVFASTIVKEITWKDDENDRRRLLASQDVNEAKAIDTFLQLRGNEKVIPLILPSTGVAAFRNRPKI